MRAHPHRRRGARPDARLRHVGLPGRHRERRHTARRRGLAVHDADPGDRGRVHPARHHQSGERSLMATAPATVAGAPATRTRYGSMSRDRRWALRWSYVFLTLFASFFLIPPIYMLITLL